ncbi:MAG: flavin reductase family protein [Flavobacteriaceae bacterium]
MHFFDQASIASMERLYRMQLINSISGYKSATLVGTQNQAGQTNVAVFNSLIHLSSQPPLLGFMLRPKTVPRHTYANLSATGFFTLNQIAAHQISDAHHSSAKYPENISEFEQTGLQAEFKADFNAPYVAEAPVQIGCRFVSEYHIQESDTYLIVGAIEQVFVQEKLLQPDGWVQLDQGEVVTINGLEGYALPQLLERFPYARPKKD